MKVILRYRRIEKIEIERIYIDDVINLYEKKDYLVIQGCGGDLKEWVTGISEMLIENEVATKDFKFNKVYTFKNDGLINLIFPLDNLNIGKLAILRLKMRDFGAMWLSDYVDNKIMKDISIQEVQFIDKEFKKVDAKIIGADGNVFNLIAICSKALKRNGYYKESEELVKRVTSSQSYDEALSIMCEYVNPVLDYEMEYNEYTDICF